jgi:DNA mismatch endonuclease (patch repair protein)
MRSIRKVNTRPEMLVRRSLHAQGYRYRIHRRDLPGSPDLVFPGRRKIIFVHGCFWHQHEGCSLARQPKSRPDYWPRKLARNVERDSDVRQRLADLGWQVLVVWECETRNPTLMGDRLTGFLEALNPKEDSGERPNHSGRQSRDA